MERIRFLIICNLLFVAGIANAQQKVSEKEAINAAINTLYNRTEILKRLDTPEIDKVHHFSDNRNNVLMYEVVFKNRTAILLSGNKACLPVLGYYTKDNNESIFDINNVNIPDGLKALLKDYADEIEWCFTLDTIKLSYQNQWQKLQQLNAIKSSSRPIVVDILLTTKWGQQWSNDGDCPAYNYYVTAKNSKQCGKENCDNRCPVGCTAVAMGQVMKYWNYPVYLPEKYYQYDWCNMSDRLNSYSPNYETERNAIARLLKDCGDNANAAYCIAKCNTSALLLDGRRALVNDFQYSSDATFRLRSSHTATTWKNFMKTDLNNGRPIIYGSLGLGDAHYWVCDGYDSDDYFHFNWGWLGDWDGWYTINGLSDVGHYNISQEALFNIYPDNTQNYCNYYHPLWIHYYMYYTIQGETSPPPYSNVPKTFTRLESVPSGNGFPTSWHTIEPGQNSTYIAHKEITLLPGFHAKAGSYFVAQIDPCEMCNSVNRSLLSNTLEDETTDWNSFLDTSSLSMYHKSNSNQNNQTDIKSETITLYPNPNSGSFTIGINNVHEIEQIEVINVLGQVVYNVQKPNNTTVNLPVGTKGTFFVKIITQTETVVKRIIVE
ncbi:MAG: C10 family peptidase [Bacteroidales bacterium]|nr:C10 family peptidase [Bacteroidales bacterium]